MHFSLWLNPTEFGDADRTAQHLAAALRRALFDQCAAEAIDDLIDRNPYASVAEQREVLEIAGNDSLAMYTDLLQALVKLAPAAVLRYARRAIRGGLLELDDQRLYQIMYDIRRRPGARVRLRPLSPRPPEMFN